MTISIRKISAIMFVSIVAVVGLGAANNLHFPEVDALRTFLKGEPTRKIEERYEEEFPLRDWITGAWATFNYLVFKDGRDGVLVGDQGWLFSTEEFILEEKSTDNLLNSVKYIDAVKKKLQAENIELKVLLLPEKAQVYQHFSPSLSPHVKMGLYEKSLQVMNEQQLNVFSGLDALKPEAEDVQTFMRTDTHWSPQGARNVADAFAKSSELTGDQAFATTSTEEVSFSGDLMKFIPVGNYFDNVGPRPEFLQKFVTETKSEGAGLGLFGEEQTIDLALVGTSYSANLNWHFVDFLKQALNRDLLNYAEEGHGPFKPMEKLLQDNTLTQQGIRQVIWEIPVRYLVQPLPEDINLTHYGV